jgi:hypothetical protein
MEWQAPPQNSFVPVRATMTCVAITPPAPITRPMISSVSTEYLTLGVVRRRHVLRTNPGCLSSVVATSPPLH